MSSDQVQSETQAENDAYLKIWQADQEHIRTRWTVTTFFMSVSFAIFAFSFQAGLVPSERPIIRFAGVLIYWFACLIHMHFYAYAKFLRTYMIEMEKSGRTTINIQGKAGILLPPNKTKWLSTIYLLAYFGLIYTAGVALLWLLGL